MFDEGSIVLKRISLSKFGRDRIHAEICRYLFDKLYLLAEFNPHNDGYGCVKITTSKLEKKASLLTRQNIRTALKTLDKMGLIHIERASKFNNAGYLIKIIQYENLNKLANQQLTTDQPTTNQQLTNVTQCYESKIELFENTANQQLTNDQPTTNQSINQRKNVRTKKRNIISGEDTPEVVSDTKPKKTRKESKPKIPSKTTAAYLAYKDAIKERHGIELSPQGGADVRSILSKLIDEYGEEKAVTIVKAYVNIKDNFLEQNLHHIKFIGSKINVVLKEAENVKDEEDIPMKYCQYREQMVPMKKILINGETRWI